MFKQLMVNSIATKKERLAGRLGWLVNTAGKYIKMNKQHLPSSFSKYDIDNPFTLG